MAAKAPLFDADFLKKLEYLSLVSRRVFRGSLLASRRTRQLGSGIEFADHRSYTYSDDFRYLDWNLFARLEQLLLKRFEEEEDLHVYFLLDCSQSMAIHPSKFDFARQVTAALAYIALADLDRIAVSPFADDLVAAFPLTRAKGRILSLLDFLQALVPREGPTDLARTVSSFVHRQRRRGLVIVVSDFYDPAGFERGLDLLRHHRYEVHAIQVHDAEEEDPDLLGDLELVDVETESSRKVTITEDCRRRYRLLFTAFQESLRTYCRRHGIGCTQTSTAISFDDLILKMMRVAGAVA